MPKNALSDAFDISELPLNLLQTMSSVGAQYGDFHGKVSAKNAPYTAAGATGLRGQAFMKNMNSDVSASTMRSEDGRDSFIAYNEGKDTPQTQAHEMEHVLSNQGLGRGSRLNSKWDEMVGSEGMSRGEIVKRLVEHAPYLQKSFGLDNESAQEGYFSKRVLGRSDAHNFLYEQLATLSALEQGANRSLTDDPYVRQHILKTPAERETYNAITGLRQTRLDAKDLPSYTRQPEKSAVKEPSSAMQRLLRIIGM